VPRRQLTAKRQQAQPRAPFKESPLVAFDPLAHELWGGVASSCGFAGVLGLLVDVDDAFACLEGVRVVYLADRSVPSLACLLLCALSERFYRRCACFFQVWVEGGEQGRV
jgi:hypothetical protein